MATFLDLKNEVKTAIIDTPATIVALVPSLVNRAIRSLQKDYNFKVMEAQADFTTAEGVRILGSKPADFKEYRGRAWRIGNDGGIRRVNVAPSRGEVLNAIGDQQTGAPRWILEALQATDGTSSYEVYPLPDGNSDWSGGEYRIRVPYYKFLATLTSDGDTNWFTNNAEEYIIHTASGYGFQYDWDEQRMSVWRTTGEALRKQVIKLNTRLLLSGIETFVPHWQGGNDPKVME